jgi:hypothetical protein
MPACRVSAILSGSSPGLPDNTFFLEGAACFFCAAFSGIGIPSKVVLLQKIREVKIDSQADKQRRL